jgi:iron(III) transport system substrate-binding protein
LCFNNSVSNQTIQEEEMKAFVKFLTILLLVSFMIGCTTPAALTPQVLKETVVVKETQQVNVVITATPVPPTIQPPATEKPLTAAEEWAKANGFGPYQSATEDWAAVEAAAKIEGKVCVYANSSKFAKLLDKWHELYPDIVLDCEDTDDIDVKMREEQKAGNVVGDIWFNSDGHILYGEFVPNEWIWSYVPPGVVEPELTPEQPIAVERHSVDVWGYNNEINKEGCPINNWWQLTEPALQGKVYMEDPINDVSTMAKYATIVEHADEMAAAYQDLYGKDWTTDEVAAPDAFGSAPANAGWLFLKKLAQNKPGIEPGGDEVDAAYASLGMDPNVEPGYGWTGYDSINATNDGEIAMAPCIGLKPVIGIMKTNYLAVANQAPHPNAAKLFIKFALTPDGFKPWNQLGTYPAVADWTLPEGSLPFADMMKQSWLMNPVYDWEWAAKVRDFWAISLLAAPSE